MLLCQDHLYGARGKGEVGWVGVSKRRGGRKKRSGGDGKRGGKRGGREVLCTDPFEEVLFVSSR